MNQRYCVGCNGRESYQVRLRNMEQNFEALCTHFHHLGSHSLLINFHLFYRLFRSVPAHDLQIGFLIILSLHTVVSSFLF